MQRQRTKPKSPSKIRRQALRAKALTTKKPATIGERKTDIPAEVSKIDFRQLKTDCKSLPISFHWVPHRQQRTPNRQQNLGILLSTSYSFLNKGLNIKDISGGVVSVSKAAQDVNRTKKGGRGAQDKE